LDNITVNPPSSPIGLLIARLNLWLDIQTPDLQISLPPTYNKFLRFGGNISTAEENLFIKIDNNSNLDKNEQGDLICSTKSWELWQTQAGGYTFTAPQNTHLKGVIIESTFQSGVVFSNLPEDTLSGYYPLQYLDNIIFVNWLGTYGDIILHASGVVVDGQGYAFIGPAEVGKSTIAKAIQQSIPSTILGEDQVVLRFLDQRFWIFGTPWHENPAMCSPVGAPLAKLFFLDRDSSPQGTTSINPADGIQRILGTAFIPYYRHDLLPGILDQLDRLAKQVPCFTLNHKLGTDLQYLFGTGQKQ